MRSCASEDSCDVDVWEFRETLLAAGDSTLFGCGDGAVARALGLPRTRPPPSVLLDMIRAWETEGEAVSAQHLLYRIQLESWKGSAGGVSLVFA